ncbi:protein C10 isoform X2 [Conger conger]|uniref:protein C10 isoform X2 n=1 Tax=Conger conger TaxID=82655 RepID=UPI002A5AA7A2|nr:protein C10 isoform X2 [Conger conger]
MTSLTSSIFKLALLDVTAGGSPKVIFRSHNRPLSIVTMASAPAQQPVLTVEQARVVLSEVIQAFSVPENAARMEEARESACNDMGKMLQLVLPVATQIQQEVVKAYGFNNEGEGVLKFARLVKMYETQDPEIAAMSAKLKSLLLPPMSTPPIGGGITTS